MKTAIVLAAAVIFAAPLGARAANADHPYQNVDHSNDAGNNTGDSQVDRLNQAQLNSNGVPASSYPSRRYAYTRPHAYYPPSAYPPAYYSPVPGYARAPQGYYGLGY